VAFVSVQEHKLPRGSIPKGWWSAGGMVPNTELVQTRGWQACRAERAEGPPRAAAPQLRLSLKFEEDKK